jgi:hypothetical protein
MENGLYSAVFGTQMGDGTGIVFLQDGQARGGDSLMAYTGTYKVTGDTLVADLLVKKHANIPGMQSVFGRDMVNITIRGRISGDQVELTGTAKEVPGAQFKARLKRISN